MNWDWEKLKKQQEGKEGGMVPPKMDDLVEKFKKFKLPGGPLLILLFVLIFFGSSMFYTVGWTKSSLSSGSENLYASLNPALLSSCRRESRR